MLIKDLNVQTDSTTLLLEIYVLAKDANIYVQDIYLYGFIYYYVVILYIHIICITILYIINTMHTYTDIEICIKYYLKNNKA